jgi:hypothetical protein
MLRVPGRFRQHSFRVVGTKVWDTLCTRHQRVGKLQIPMDDRWRQRRKMTRKYDRHCCIGQNVPKFILCGPEDCRLRMKTVHEQLFTVLNSVQLTLLTHATRESVDERDERTRSGKTG